MFLAIRKYNGWPAQGHTVLEKPKEQISYNHFDAAKKYFIRKMLFHSNVKIGENLFLK